MTLRTCPPLKLKPHGYRGTLITVCGVDGSGKSSLLGNLEAACRHAGLSCTRTQTPTRRIRDDAVFRSLVDHPCRTSNIGTAGGDRSIDVLGLLLSIMGDLVQHTTDTIVPALERGEVVLCDRYIFTSQAEIGARSDLAQTEPVLMCIAEHVLRPDLAFGLDVSSATSTRRVRARNDVHDQPTPIRFLDQQIAAYRAVFGANALMTLDTEKGLDETFVAVMREVGRIVPLLAPSPIRNAACTEPAARRGISGVVAPQPSYAV